MNILVTGGAGFIGRWVVKRLVSDGHEVTILDNLSNGSTGNIQEFLNYNNKVAFIKGDIKDRELLDRVFRSQFNICYHLAASINVQDSIDDPKTTFNNDVVGTFNILEECRKTHTKIVFMSTCMVYDKAKGEEGIDELHPIKPASPYAGSKIAGESIVLSYWHAYKLPAVVIRPFNTYGPLQKSSGEGGVVSIFIKKKLNGEMLSIYGDGSQTRDLLYVEDCADFVVEAGYSEKANGEIINAGTSRDISINDLAKMIAERDEIITHIAHIHPQSEIQKLLCNHAKARNILGWEPSVDIIEGIKRTESWIRNKNA